MSCPHEHKLCAECGASFFTTVVPDVDLDQLVKALRTNRRREESYTDHITRLAAAEVIEAARRGGPR